MLTPGSSSFLHPAPHPEVFQEELQAKLQARKQSLGALGGMNLETLEPTDLVWFGNFDYSSRTPYLNRDKMIDQNDRSNIYNLQSFSDPTCAELFRHGLDSALQKFLAGDHELLGWLCPSV